MKARRAIAASCLLLTAALAGCGEEQESEPAAVSQSLSVEAFDFYFEPTTLAVDVGARVTIELTNSGSVSHSWTSTDLDAEIEVAEGESGTVEFTVLDEPGSVDFFCKFHPDEMQGTVSIGDSEEPVEEAPEEDDDDEDVDVDVDTEEESDTGDDTQEGPGY